MDFNDFDLITNFTGVAATLNNIGPGLELVGPTQNFFHLFRWVKNLVLIFDMLAGRLELFPNAADLCAGYLEEILAYVC